MNFTISVNAEMDTNTLGTILSQFQTDNLPRLRKLQDYYKGKQKINEKFPSDTGKPCNKVTTNFCHSITNAYAGYLAGKPITYSGEDIDEIVDVLKYNDYRDEDTNLLTQALIYGRGYEICYIDNEGKVRFVYVDAKEMIPVYSDDLNHDLRYVIRFQQYEDPVTDTTKYWVEVYSDRTVRKYVSTPGFSSFNFIEEYEHHFNQVPIIVFDLSEDSENCFEQIISMQDAYNEIQSSELDDYASFCDAYMMIKGMDADADDLANMKQHRVLILDKDSDASYLTKQTSDVQVENMLKRLNDNIQKCSQAVDFGDERFLAQSGESLKWKLLNFETCSGNIEAHMKKALQKRIELIVSTLMLVNGEEAQRDVTISFTRNIPTSLTELAQEINGFRGIVSDKTLLELIPFIDDVDEELNKLNEQKLTNMQLYQFESLDMSNEENDTDEI